MAVSLVYSPSSAATQSFLSISQDSVHLHSSYLHKGFTYSSICLRNQNLYFKLYMIPARPAIALVRHCMLKASASNGSISSDVTCQENIVLPGVSDSNDFPRFKYAESSSNPSDGFNDFETQLQELFDEVISLIKTGKKTEAIDLLQANYEAVKERINAGASGIEEAATLDIIALGCMAIGDLKFVESLLNMLDKIVCGLKDDEPFLDPVLLHMASMYSAMGKFEKSSLVYQRVIVLLECTYGQSSTFLVSPLLGMAKALGSGGKATKAVQLYHRAISILESSRGAESEDLAVPLFNLGHLLIKEGRTTDAESTFSRMLSIYTKVYGENSGRVGTALCSLAHVKCATGDADAAISLYKKALEVIKDADYMALDDGIMEKMRIDLAELLHVVGRGKEGRELLEECLLITEKYKGKEHPSFVTHLVNLAISYSQSNSFVEAERLLRTSLDIMERSVGPDDQSITYPMLHLAVTLYHLNRCEEAEQLALEVLRIREKAFGKDSLPVGEALDCLVSIKSKLGGPDVELLDLLKQVLKIQEEECGYESREVMTTLKKIVFYLDKIGRMDEKLYLKRRLLALRMKYNKIRFSVEYSHY